MSQPTFFLLSDLATRLGAELVGDPDLRINGLGTLSSAGPDQISFLANLAYAGQLASCQAGAVILSRDHGDAFDGNRLLSDNPYLSFARASALFDREPVPPAGVHPSAQVHQGASLGADVTIGPFAIVGEGARLGDRTRIGSHCVIGDGVVLGEDCALQAGVTIYHAVRMGDRVRVHSGSVIGADGFGFARDGAASVRIHQLGSVVIGNDVDIGACTTIDRGAIEDTTIADGVKIDNQVQIGHNCVIGENTVLCGCVSLAGSVTIGKNCIMGGRAGSVGHIEIADGVQVSAMSLVSKSISEPGMYSSGTGLMDTRDWKRNIVRFQQLEGMARRLKKLEKKTDNN